MIKDANLQAFLHQTRYFFSATTFWSFYDKGCDFAGYLTSSTLFSVFVGKMKTFWYIEQNDQAARADCGITMKDLFQK